MRKIYAFVVFSFVIHSAFAQIKFQKTYGGSGLDEGRCVKQTFDDGYIIAGSTSSFGAGLTDVILLKVDSLGNPQWQKTFGGANVDKGYSLDITSDSGFVICGYTNSFGSGGYDIYLIRTDKNGDSLWTKTYGGSDWDFGYSVRQTSDGGFIIGGGTYSFGSGNEDVYVIKTNSNGDMQWQKNYGYANKDYANEVIETSDGDFLAIGITSNGDSLKPDAYLLKLNPSGDTLWTRIYGGAGEDYGMSVKEILPNEYIIGGYTKCDACSDYNELYFDYDASGNFNWGHELGGSNNEIVNYITKCTNGDFVSIGRNDAGAGSYDMRLVRLSSAGWAQSGWTPTFGRQNYEEGFHVEQTSDYGFILVGLTESFGNFSDKIFLVKIDSAGNEDPNITNIVISTQNIYNKPQHCYLFQNSVNEITVSIPNDIVVKDYSMKIYSSEGRCVKELTLSSHLNHIPLNDLSSGIFFYTLINTNESICSGKISIIR